MPSSNNPLSTTVAVAYNPSNQNPPSSDTTGSTDQHFTYGEDPSEGSIAAPVQVDVAPFCVAYQVESNRTAPTLSSHFVKAGSTTRFHLINHTMSELRSRFGEMVHLLGGHCTPSQGSSSPDPEIRYSGGLHVSPTSTFMPSTGDLNILFARALTEPAVSDYCMAPHPLG